VFRVRCVFLTMRERERRTTTRISFACFRKFRKIRATNQSKGEEKERETKRAHAPKKKRRKEEKKKKEKKNTYAASLESLASAVVEPTHVSINADYYYLGTVTYRLFLEDSLYRFILNHRSGLTPSPPLASKASFNSNGNASVH
jgi:hypothetical protein